MSSFLDPLNITTDFNGVMVVARVVVYGSCAAIALIYLRRKEKYKLIRILMSAFILDWLSYQLLILHVFPSTESYPSGIWQASPMSFVLERDHLPDGQAGLISNLRSQIDPNGGYEQTHCCPKQLTKWI